MNAAVLKNSALRTLTSRTSPDDCLVKSARPSVVAAIDASLHSWLTTAPRGCRCRGRRAPLRRLFPAAGAFEVRRPRQYTDRPAREKSGRPADFAVLVPNAESVASMTSADPTPF